MTKTGADLSANKRAFILEALRENVRLDGRALDQLRPLRISFGAEFGHAQVSLGKTSVIVRVSAEVAKPRAERESDGLFTVAVELNDMAIPGFETGRQSEQETSISRTLDRIIRRSNALDIESLCLAKGIACWHVRADVHVVDADGGLIDTCCIAILTALQRFRLPESSVRDGQITVYSLEERVPTPLNLTKLPLSITFNIYNKGRLFVMDATADEEAVSEGTLLVALDKTGEIALYSKSEGSPADPLTMIQCSNLALMRVKELHQIIKKRLDEDVKLQEQRERQRTGISLSEATAANERGRLLYPLRLQSEFTYSFEKAEKFNRAIPPFATQAIKGYKD
ncbi:hypothetical protein KEM54_005637 [Ascosphaera aggregata]|nr:hypothetical protein KEM54_005637 [Ascosphaera aggregata]